MNICFPPRFFCSVASDECSMYVREAFRDLANLANLKMFVDFPNNPSACREHEPSIIAPAGKYVFFSFAIGQANQSSLRKRHVE